VGHSEADKEAQDPERGRDGDPQEVGPGREQALEGRQRRVGQEHEQAADDRQRNHRGDAAADRGHDRLLGKVADQPGQAAR
jgi:hypothetical protein